MLTALWLLSAAAVLAIPFTGSPDTGRSDSGRPRAGDPARDPVRELVRAVRRSTGSYETPVVEGLPLTLDLAAAVLRAGRSVPEALELAGGALDRAHRAELERVAALLRLGAAPGEAWSAATSPGLARVAPVAIRSAASGVALAGALERAAAEQRAAAATAAAAVAQRAGVHAMGPLAACFLPAFVLLGIVPVVVGIAGTVFGALR